MYCPAVIVGQRRHEKVHLPRCSYLLLWSDKGRRILHAVLDAETNLRK